MQECPPTAKCCRSSRNKTGGIDFHALPAIGRVLRSGWHKLELQEGSQSISSTRSRRATLARFRLRRLKSASPNEGGKTMFEFLQGLLALSDVLIAILVIVVAALAWMYWRSRKLD